MLWLAAYLMGLPPTGLYTLSWTHDQIPAANYGHLEVPRPKQDVVPIDIVPDHIPKQHTASQMLNSNLDNSHTIEVSMKDITVRISNDADPVLLTRTFRMLQEFSC